VVVVTEIVRKQFRLGDASLSVLCAGASGPPVVLLHGIPTGAELWRGVMGDLADSGFQAFSPDLPGYGHTVLPASADHSLAGSATMISRWMTENDLAPAWVVGHDAGGAVGQLLAVRHPETVDRLTLINSIVEGSWPALRARVAVVAARLHLVRAAGRLRMVPNPYMRWAVRRAFADAGRAASAPFDRVIWDTKFSTPQGRAGFERSVAALSAADTTLAAKGLGQLTIPCQLVWGMDDPYQPWPRAGRRLAELIVAPAVTQLEDCGHLVPLECGGCLVEAMLGWRAGTG
jgi:pimeloyl-ACP methyl ester carboxylesterase